MASALSVAGAGLAALLAVAAASHSSQAPTPPSGGHLILQIEGDANALRITRVTRKPDPCGLNRVESTYAIVIHDTDGKELSRHPLDLSMFDLDPAHVGNPPRVEGCSFIDTRVGALANIPHDPAAARLTIVHGDRTIGELDAIGYETLLTEEIR